MNIDVLEVFDGVKNVEFTKFHDEKEAELPIFTLTEPSVEEWNAKARKQNTKVFIEHTGRQPEDYHEVLSWVFSMIEDTENASAAVG